MREGEEGTEDERKYIEEQRMMDPKRREGKHRREDRK